MAREKRQISPTGIYHVLLRGIDELFSEKEDFKLVLEKFAIAFALAEIRARKHANSDGMISPNAFRTHINNFLRELTDEE